MEANTIEDKIAMISSSPAVAKALRDHLGALAGPHLSVTTNLGVDATGGLARRQAGRSRKLKLRMALLKRKVKRLEKQRTFLGKRTIRMCASGPTPGAFYGCTVFGMSDNERLP
ncbi:unnamed protein product, partial [Prorocentrum cordatum]